MGQDDNSEFVFKLATILTVQRTDVRDLTIKLIKKVYTKLRVIAGEEMMSWTDRQVPGGGGPWQSTGRKCGLVIKVTQSLGFSGKRR